MLYRKESSAKSLTGIYVDHKSEEQSEKIVIRCNAPTLNDQSHPNSKDSSAKSFTPN